MNLKVNCFAKETAYIARITKALEP